MKLRLMIASLLIYSFLTFCQNDIFAENAAPDTWTCIRYDTSRELIIETDFTGADFYIYSLKKLEVSLIFSETVSKGDKDKALKELKDNSYQCWSDYVEM